MLTGPYDWPISFSACPHVWEVDFSVCKQASRHCHNVWDFSFHQWCGQQCWTAVRCRHWCRVQQSGMCVQHEQQQGSGPGWASRTPKGILSGGWPLPGMHAPKERVKQIKKSNNYIIEFFLFFNRISIYFSLKHWQPNVYFIHCMYIFMWSTQQIKLVW